jgi:hypothetical protein
MANKHIHTVNPDQHSAFDQIMDAVQGGNGLSRVTSNMQGGHMAEGFQGVGRWLGSGAGGVSEGVIGGGGLKGD